MNEHTEEVLSRVEALIGPRVVKVKVFAHRVGMDMADKIMDDEIVVQQGGMRHTFSEWFKLTTYQLSRVMMQDESMERVTAIGTDPSGCILVGIKRLDRPEVQLTLEW